MMSSERPRLHHDFAAVLVEPSAFVRSLLSPGEFQAQWARQLLNAGDYSKLERQNLHDLTRPCRMAAADRSGFGVLFRLAPQAPLDASLWGFDYGRLDVVARGKYALPSPDDAHDAEEESNKAGNITGRRHRERRTTSSYLDFREAMRMQALASHLVAASEASALSR